MIPHVTHDQETIRLYAGPEDRLAIFEMDTEQARELIVMLVGSIAHIEGGTDRLALLFDELVDRYKKPAP